LQQELLKKISLSLFAIVSTLLLGEVIVRFLPSSKSNYFLYAPNAKYIFTPDSNILYGIKGIKHFQTDEDGIRCKMASNSDQEKWLCIGGSTTECTYLSDDEMWMSTLQDSINSHSSTKKIWIGNVGKSGNTTREHIVTMKRFVPKIKNLKGIVLMVGLNDFLKRLSKDSLFENNFKLNKTSEDSLARKLFVEEKREDNTSWVKHSELAFRLSRLYKKYFSKTIAATTVDRSGTVYKQWRENRQSASEISDSLPNLNTALEEYERNVLAIIESAKTQHLQLVFINQTALWKDSLNDFESKLIWMGGVGKFQLEKKHAYYAPSALHKGLALYNEKLKSICEVYKIQLIDITTLPKDTSIFYDDCHFHERGSKAIANLIFEQWSK
jgi:lysophospholipase L1-like esterase